MNKENCALKLVDEIILYYDARSKKHRINLPFSLTVLKVHRLINKPLLGLSSSLTVLRLCDPCIGPYSVTFPKTTFRNIHIHENFKSHISVSKCETNQMQQLVNLFLINCSSTCFGRLYSHPQEVRLRFHLLRMGVKTPETC